VGDLRDQPGRDIWLFGGGNLFGSLLAAGLVDQIDIAVMPVVLGGGIPLVSIGTPRSRLGLTRSAVSPAGIVNLQYDVDRVTRRTVSDDD
jgi:dihydrofolate reductase